MQFEQDKTRVKPSNKVALETEKEKDAAEKTVEELNWTGHNWLLKFGEVDGRMSCTEKEFILGPRKF